MGGRNSALRAESYCDWWSLAGVDALVGEEPAGWLKLPVANDPKPKPKIVTENEPPPLPAALQRQAPVRSEEHTSELQSLMRNSYADFCLKKKQGLHRHYHQNETHTSSAIDRYK